MTNISKCLVVFATVASLAFLAVVSLSAVGGPNYEAEINDPTLKGVVFEKKIDETTGKVTWSVQTRNSAAGSDGQVAKDAKVLADAILKAHQEVQKQQTKRGEELDALIDLRKKQIAEAQRLIKIDRQAMDDRIKSLEKQLAAQNSALSKLKTEIIATQDSTLKKKYEVKRRQNDIRRLGNLIAELQADRERLAKQQQKLESLIATIQGTNRLLKQRHQQLIQRTTAGKTAVAP